MKGLVLVGGILIVGVGAWLFFAGEQTTKEGAMEGVSEGRLSESNPEPTMIQSIGDAMKAGSPMQCTYVSAPRDTGESVQSTVVVEGGKFSSTTLMGDVTMYALFDGEDQYTWTSKDVQGMKMSKDCLSKMQDIVKGMTPPTDTSAPQPQDASKGFDAAQNVKCEAAGKVDLTIPAGITFTDQCAMMEQSQKMMEQYKNMIPSGVPQP